MKTVPTVRLADTADAAVLPDLPEEIQLALADIAGAAREGLLVMSVAAGLAVMTAMFDAEISQACGPKGRHDTKRAAVRHGAGVAVAAAMSDLFADRADVTGLRQDLHRFDCRPPHRARALFGDPAAAHRGVVDRARGHYVDGTHILTKAHEPD